MYIPGSLFVVRVRTRCSYAVRTSANSPANYAACPSDTPPPPRQIPLQKFSKPLAGTVTELNMCSINTALASCCRQRDLTEMAAAVLIATCMSPHRPGLGQISSGFFDSVESMCIRCTQPAKSYTMHEGLRPACLSACDIR